MEGLKSLVQVACMKYRNEEKEGDRMSENVEETPFKKPRRKIWKIVLPVIVVLFLASLGGMYVSAYTALYDALSKSSETFYVSDVRMEDVRLFPPSADVIAEYTIFNPTGTTIRLVEVSFDIWVDGTRIGELTATDKTLPAGGSAVLNVTIHVGSEILDVMMSPPYTMRISGEVVGSTTILFLTVSRTHSITETQTITS